MEEALESTEQARQLETSVTFMPTGHPDTGSGLSGYIPGWYPRRLASGGGGRRKRTCRDCRKCGFFKNNMCNNPNKRAGRSIR